MNVFDAGKGNLSTMISLMQEWYLSNRDYGDYRSVNDWQIARKSNFFFHRATRFKRISACSVLNNAK